jgi:two-component system OmpR family response regulator
MDAANILVDGSSISTHIKRIRRKFSNIDPEFDAIETIYGMGYRWNQ